VRLTVNSFMASGGDGYGVFNDGTDRVTGVMDVDALEAFVKSQPVLQVPAPGRITRLN
jgi:5'-nucleotidase